MEKEVVAKTTLKTEVLPPDMYEWYLGYADSSWNSIDAMNYPDTGLPADQLHYLSKDGKPTEETCRIDKTSPTNIGFSLACVGAAAAMEFISPHEAEQRIERTLTSIEEMIADPEVFFPINGEKGLFINWIQPSTGKVLNKWPDTDLSVKQQLSSVDNAWLVAFSKLVAAQFPNSKERINRYLDKIDLSFMIDNETGFFRGCYALDLHSFEEWQYRALSEARIAYLVCDDNIIELMGNLINRKSERSIIEQSGHYGRTTWDGEFFQLGWPRLLVPEDKLNEQWGETYQTTINKQRQFGTEHNGGHYGFSAGLDPDGKYYEFRVPEAGESTAEYNFQPVITISALVNMGLQEPVETYQALRRLHQEYPGLRHERNGDGDTVNTVTRAVQRDQLLPNQATNLLSTWSIVKNGEPQNLFMGAVSPAVQSVYQRNPLW